MSQSQCLQLARKQAPTMAYLNVCNADVLPVAASMRPDIGLCRRSCSRQKWQLSGTQLSLNQLKDSTTAFQGAVRLEPTHCRRRPVGKADAQERRVQATWAALCARSPGTPCWALLS